MKKRGGKRALVEAAGAAQAGLSTSTPSGRAGVGAPKRARRVLGAEFDAELELGLWNTRPGEGTIRGYTTEEQFSEAERLRDGRSVRGSWSLEFESAADAAAAADPEAPACRPGPTALAICASVCVRGLFASTRVVVSLDGCIVAAECSCELEEAGILCSHTAAVLLCVSRADEGALVRKEASEDPFYGLPRRARLPSDLAPFLRSMEDAVRAFNGGAVKARTACPLCDAEAHSHSGLGSTLTWCVPCDNPRLKLTERRVESPLRPLIQCIDRLRREAAKLTAEGELEKAVRLVEIASARLSAVVPAEHGSCTAFARALTGLVAIPASHPEAPDGLRQRCLQAAALAVNRLKVDRCACPGLYLCHGAVDEPSTANRLLVGSMTSTGSEAVAGCASLRRRPQNIYSSDITCILDGSVTGSKAVECLADCEDYIHLERVCDLASQVEVWFECLFSIQRFAEAERFARATKNGAWLARVARARGDGRRSALHALSPDLCSSPRDLRALAAEYREEDPLAAFLLLARAARQLHGRFSSYFQAMTDSDVEEDNLDRGLFCLLYELDPEEYFEWEAPSEDFEPTPTRDPWDSDSLAWYGDFQRASDRMSLTAKAILNALACAVDVALGFVKTWLAPGMAPEGFLFREAGRAAGELVTGGGEAVAFERLIRTEGTLCQVATEEGRALVLLEACATVVTEFGRYVPGAWRAAEAFVRVGQPALALSVASGALRRHSKCGNYSAAPVGDDDFKGFNYLVELLNRWETEPPGSPEAQARANYLAGGFGATVQGLFAYAVDLYDKEASNTDAALRACRFALDFAVAHRDVNGNHVDTSALLSDNEHWCGSSHVRVWALNSNVFQDASDAEVVTTLTDPSFAPERFAAAGDAGFQVEAEFVFRTLCCYRLHHQGRTLLAVELAAYCARVGSCGRASACKLDWNELVRHLAEAATDPLLPAATRQRAMAALPAAIRLSIASRRPSAAEEYLQRAISGAPEPPRKERLLQAVKQAREIRHNVRGHDYFPKAVAVCTYFSADDAWQPAPTSAELAPYYARLEQSSDDLKNVWTVLEILIKAGDDESIPPAARAAGEAVLPAADLLQSVPVEALVERGILAAARGTSALALCAALLAPPLPPPSGAAPAPPLPPPPPAGGDLLRLAEAAARRAIELGGAPDLRPFPEPESMLAESMTPEGALALFRLVPHWRFLEAARGGRPPASPAFVAERDAALMEHWPSAVGRGPPALLELLFESLFRFGLGLHVAPYARAVARGRPTLQLLACLLRGHAASKDRPIAFLPLLTEHPVADHDPAPGPNAPGDWPPLRAFLAETFKRGFERGARGDTLLQLPTVAPEASLETKKRLYTGYMDLLWMVAAVDAPLACELSRPVLREAVLVLGLHMSLNFEVNQYPSEVDKDKEKLANELCELFNCTVLRARAWHKAHSGGCGPESEWHRLLCELKGAPYFEALKDKAQRAGERRKELDVRGRWALRTAQEREEDGDYDEGDNWCRGDDDWPREEEDEEEDS
eukprot:tig00000254_g22496.t1